MKKRFLIKNPISLIFLTTVVSFILLLLLYGIIKFEEKIENKMIEISTADIISIVNNNISYIKTILENKNYVEEIKKNEETRKDIENKLELLVTPNIKYSYLLYKDSRGIFRFLADGAVFNEKAILDQKFDIDSPQWIEIFKTKKPLSIVHEYLQELSISYLFPILNEKNEVKLILVIDFSVKKIQEINIIIALMKSGLVFIIVIVFIFLLVLIIQTIKYFAIKKTAFIDKLTGIYNRNYLQDSMEFFNLNDYILATLDIDHFKIVNDTYGHDIGDKVLKEVASIVSLSIRDTEDIFVRYGGEEFLIMAKRNRDDSLNALNVIERILKNIQQHKFYYTKKDYIHMTVSIGINLTPNKSRNFEDAFKLADIALYNAKNKGRNNIQIYDEAKNNDGAFMSINDIKDALDEDKIICYYQQIIDNNTNEISHYEALLRIVNKKGDIVTPDKILPTIEGTFISRNITKSVLNISYKKLIENSSININVNLQSKDLIDDSIMEILQKYAKKENISNRLGIEIFQNEDLINSKNSKNNLLLLKDLGYKIFVDDFGSGYSNFIYLLKIKTDYIKIDGTIIKDILVNKVAFLLVKNIVTFAKEANIKVIAENVDTKEVYDEIKSLGIEYSQGYYFSLPKEVL